MKATTGAGAEPAEPLFFMGDGVARLVMGTTIAGAETAEPSFLMGADAARLVGAKAA